MVAIVACLDLPINGVPININTIFIIFYKAIQSNVKSIIRIIVIINHLIIIIIISLFYINP